MLTLDGQPTARPTNDGDSASLVSSSVAVVALWFAVASSLSLSLSPLQSGVDALVMVVLARPVAAWWSAAISTWELLHELEERESVNAAAVLDHFQTAC